jgi:hypothetical protein
MDQLRVQWLGSVVAFAVIAIGCGEAPPTVIVDGGHATTVFTNQGQLDGGVDAGARDAGFTWVDTGGYDAGWIYMNQDGGVDGGTDGGCQVTMCFTGAPTRGGSNTNFDDLCNSPALPNVIRSCDALSCYNTFNTFGVSSASLYSKLFESLDTNGDNRVDGKDKGCRANLLGYSWGGITANEVAGQLANDNRVEPESRKITRLFVMDPYQPLKSMTVPTNVQRFIEFRHSISPSNDCSRSAPLGPYQGLEPKCYPNQSCYDYDYSQSASAAYPNSEGGSWLGSQIGHCEVPSVAAPAIIAEFQGIPYNHMPTQVPVRSP